MRGFARTQIRALSASLSDAQALSLGGEFL
jgi:hypothetical protein